jgi:hypothetical protein
MRCHARRQVRGRVLRCEEEEGHASAHYCGREWWPNKEGLPRSARPARGGAALAGWIAAGLVLAGIICWLVLRWG